MESSKKICKFLKIFINFFLIIIRMEQLRRRNTQRIISNRMLGVENTLLDLEKRKEIEKDEKREDNIIKDVKIFSKEERRRLL